MAKLTHENWKSLIQALALVIIAIVTLEVTSLIQHYYIRQNIREEATRRAEGQMEETNLKITDVMNQVETAVRNSVWAVRRLLDNPDTLAYLTSRIVETNDFISGSAVAFVENYYPDKGRMHGILQLPGEGVVHRPSRIEGRILVGALFRQRRRQDVHDHLFRPRHRQ